MPGTPVVVCEGDQLVVDVVNHMAAEVTSVHFHGNDWVVLVSNICHFVGCLKSNDYTLLLTLSDCGAYLPFSELCD